MPLVPPTPFLFLTSCWGLAGAGLGLGWWVQHPAPWRGSLGVPVCGLMHSDSTLGFTLERNEHLSILSGKTLKLLSTQPASPPGMGSCCPHMLASTPEQ